MSNDDFISLEEELVKEIEIREKLNPNYYYDAKLPSIKMARDMGFCDSDIEKAFNITIRQEDKS